MGTASLTRPLQVRKVFTMKIDEWTELCREITQSLHGYRRIGKDRLETKALEAVLKISDIDRSIADAGLCRVKSPRILTDSNRGLTPISVNHGQRSDPTDGIVSALLHYSIQWLSQSQRALLSRLSIEPRSGTCY